MCTQIMVHKIKSFLNLEIFHIFIAVHESELTLVFATILLRLLNLTSTQHETEEKLPIDHETCLWVLIT